MVDFLPSRPMEDFFVFPTQTMDKRRHRSPVMTLNNDFLYNHSAPEQLHSTPTPSRSSSLQDTESMAELRRKAHFPSLWQGYTSDEEAASPLDNDELDLVFSPTDGSAARDRSIPDQLIDSCDAVEQQCCKAQAVRIFSAGRAKMISVPKPITIPSKRRIGMAVSGPSREQRRPSSPHIRRRRTSSPHIRQRRPSSPHVPSADESVSARTSHDSGDDSLSSYGAASPASTAPSSIYESSVEGTQHKKSYSRHVPLMEAAAASPTSPMSALSVRFFRREAAKQMSVAPVAPAPAPPPLRRMTNKLSSNFGIARKEVPKRDPLDAPTQPTSQSRPPTRGSSLNSKMVARGANEREPPLRLPPFPNVIGASGRREAHDEYQSRTISAS